VIRASTILDKQKMAGDKVIPFVVEGLPDDIDYLSDIPALEAMLNGGGQTEGKRYAT
jgi:hypothetical protein